MKRLDARMWSVWYDGPAECEHCGDLAMVGVTGLPDTDAGRPVDLCFACIDELEDDYDVHWLDRDGGARAKEYVHALIERTCP